MNKMIALLTTFLFLQSLCARWITSAKARAKTVFGHLKTTVEKAAVRVECRRRSSALETAEMVNILHRQIRLPSPIEPIVFSDCSRFWNPPRFPQQQSKYFAIPVAQQIFLPSRFWIVTWPAATRVFLRTTNGGRRERAWERVWISSSKFYLARGTF